MNERPILLSAPMVRAILAGTKTQTRRLVKLPAWAMECNEDHEWEMDGEPPWPHAIAKRTGCMSAIECPYGVPGERLWVRESWGLSLCGNRVSLAPEAWPDGWPVERLRYAADFETREEWIAAIGSSCGRPSIHMPRWASRITLEITDVRVERLQEISEADAEAEGCETRIAGQGEYGPIRTYRTGFVHLWDSINAERAPWAANPWVWVLCFKVLP